MDFPEEVAEAPALHRTAHRSPAHMNLQEKEQKLEGLLHELKRVLVAYSGGVDSAYLAWKAHQVLGNNALAVTAESPSVPSHQRRMALQVAAQFGFPHEVIRTDEVENPEYRENPPNRCYFCKDELFSRLSSLARERAFACVLDGLNADDLGDYRPGRSAAEQHGVRSPLVEVGLTKEEIRELSRHARASHRGPACLRLPRLALSYGVKITDEKLRLVDRGEEALRAMGFRVFRVRHHEEMVRLEFRTRRPRQGAESEDGCRSDRGLQGTRVQIRHSRSRGIPFRFGERSACPVSRIARRHGAAPLEIPP